MSLADVLKAKKDAEAANNPAKTAAPMAAIEGKADTTLGEIKKPVPAPVVQGSVDEDKPVEYVFNTPNSEALSIQLPSGTVQAKDSVLRLTQKQKDELDALLATGRPDIAQNLIYIDVKAAEEIARKHRETAQAGRGGLHSAQGAERTNSGDYKAVNLDGAKVPEGSSTNLKHSTALADELRGTDEEEEARRNAALALQSTTTLEVEEEEAFHAEDGSLEVDPKKQV